MGYWKSKPPVGTPLNRSAAISRGLLGQWLLAETGTSCNDSLGVLPATSVVGNVGAASQFGLLWPTSNAQKGFSPGSDLRLTAPAQITVMAVVKPSSAAANMAIVSRWQVSGNAASCYLLYLGQDGAVNKFSFGIEQSNAMAKIAASTATFAANERFVLVGVADGATVRVYKNGVDAGGSIAYNGTLNQNATNATYFGNLRGSDNIYPFLGLIETLAIWNRGLTPLEVSQVSAEPYAMMAAPPLARYNAWKTGILLRRNANLRTGSRSPRLGIGGL